MTEDELRSHLASLLATLKTAIDPFSDPLGPIVARVTPSPGSLRVTEDMPATVKLTWLSKDVLFRTAGFEAGMRTIPDLTTLSGSIAGPLNPPLGGPAVNTPGEIGQMVAELPSTVTTELPVTATIEWEAKDENGQLLSPTRYTVDKAGDQATFRFVPTITGEDLGNTPAPTIVRIVPTVRLSATLPVAGSTAVEEPKPPAAPRALPAALIEIPAIVVPTVLALFNHNFFDLSNHRGVRACVLILVPPSGPYRDVAGIVNALTKVSDTMRAVSDALTALPLAGSTTAIAKANAFASIQRLISLLGAAAARDPALNQADPVYVIVRPSTGELNLAVIHFYTVVLHIESADNRLGSVFFLGVPAKNATFFNQIGNVSTLGAFTVVIPPGELAAVIEDLHNDPPPSMPPSAVSTTPTPPAVYVPATEGVPGSFGDRISSLSFPFP